MSLGFIPQTIIAVHDIYVSYKVGAEYRSAPVVFLAIKTLPGQDSDVVPIYWNLPSQDWQDGRLIPGFLGVVKTKLLETHYQATEADLEQCLGAHANISSQERDEAIAQSVLDIVSGMVAMKRVRKTLASKLPNQIP